MPSLLTALLELQPKVYQEPPQGSTDRLTQYRGMDQQKKKQVHDKLYAALYSIIEYSTMPQNRDLNMAIGNALERAIKDDRTPLTEAEQSQIDTLGNVLRQVVTEAVDEIRVP